MSDEVIERRLHELRETSKRYASALATREHLDEFKKSKLAILMKKYELQGHKTTSAQEREARADDQYIELLEGLKTATEQAESLRWELRLAEAGIDIWRTRESSRRAERKGYGA